MPTEPWPPGVYNLFIYRGDTYQWRYLLWQDENMTEPTDLTGWTAASQIRNKPDGRRVVDLDCTIELPNIIDVALLPIPSRSVVSGEHDIQLTSDDGRVMTVVRGDVTVVRNITVEPIYP